MDEHEHRLVSGNSSKAGLPSEWSEINSRIREASKESRFTAAQDRKSAELEGKIRRQREQLNEKLEQVGLIKKAAKMVDGRMEGFEKEQAEDFRKWREVCWVCVDMDAFFASVECLDAPELKNIPMAVGDKSMLSTSNYPARKFGVTAAMPGYIALKLCPDLVLMPLRYDRYKEMSGRVAEIFRKYDANMTMWSLDEAFLRFSGTEGTDFCELVQRMRDEVKESTGLTCSAGIAANPLLAKLASNYQKPDGQFEINRTDVKEMRSFLFAQPTIKLPGIGKVMNRTLEELLGIKTIGDLYGKRHLLPLVFKEKTVKSLLCKSIGHSEPHETGGDLDSQDEDQKSVSCERTFVAGSGVEYESVLWEICENLREDVGKMRISEIGRVGIKLKTVDFRVFTRERTITIGKGSVGDIFKIATGLLSDFNNDNLENEFRLIGVRLSSLKYEKGKGSLKRLASKTLLDEWLTEENQSESGDVVKCPVCLKDLKDGNDLVKVNEHVDECLTKLALKEILK